MPASSASLRNKLKLRQLALLAELESAGSLHRAADRLGMSQPAASRLIQELEDLMGSSLFERTSRGMTPTDMGRMLMRHASLFLAGLDHVYEEAVALRTGNAGVLRVGLFPGTPPRLMGAAITRLKSETPLMDVHVVEGPNDQLLASLRDGDLNLVVGRSPGAGESEGFEFEFLLKEYFSVVCGADNQQPPAAPADLADLVHFPWILPVRSSPLRTNLEGLFLGQCGRQPANLIESTSLPLNVALMIAGDYLAVMQTSLAREHVARGELRILMKRLPDLVGLIGIFTRSGETPVSQVLRMTDSLRLAGAELAAKVAQA